MWRAPNTYNSLNLLNKCYKDFSLKMTQYVINDIKEFIELDESTQSLILAAIKAREYSYSPYSNFPVGAAVRTSDGFVYTGCNIENGAFSASICAERTAASKAISEGKCEFSAVAVVGQQETGFTTPCGVCRQFLSEFITNNDIPLYVTKPTNPPLGVLCTSILELLPKSFSFSK